MCKISQIPTVDEQLGVASNGSLVKRNYSYSRQRSVDRLIDYYKSANGWSIREEELEILTYICRSYSNADVGSE